MEIKDWMMRTSPKVKRKQLPRYLYHGTPSQNTFSIRQEGLRVHPYYGQSYFADSIENVMKFIGGDVTIFRVDTRKLNLKFLRISLDHNKSYYGDFECYAYYLDIKPSCLEQYMAPK
ncbi:hypothetical protein [Rossellomorea marisflavi]|uniref:hypothetical protein n=1 Tax=Rossellomorea marisflavi TaxID=189381 RepID=UPI003F9FF7CC